MRRTLGFALAVMVGTAIGIGSLAGDAHAASPGASALLSSNGSVGYSITFLRASSSASLRGRWTASQILPGRVRPPTRPPVGAVPEPGALLVFGAGALVIGAALRRRS